MYLKKITLSLIVSIQLLTVYTGIAQETVPQIDKLMTVYHDNGYFNGSVLIAEKGKIIYKKGFGMANMEWETPNQPDTKHRLASISKQFTAMAILQLVQENKLALTVPITKYLPNYPKKNGNKITIHHLLTHSAGIPNYTQFPNFIKDISRNPYTPTRFIEIFDGFELKFEPGAKFSYCNSDYFLLGAIIEKVTGKSYEQVIKEKILTPLKMMNTGYDHHDLVLKNRASGYEKNGVGYKNATYLDMSIPYAAGALYSTAEDLFLWDRALYTDTLLSRKNLKLMFTPHIPAWGHSYGYGWTIRTTKPDELSKDAKVIVGHTGIINGFNTSISRVTSDEVLVVLLNNTGLTTLDDIGDSILSILYDQSYSAPKKSLAHSLLLDIQKQGITAALQQFDTNKTSEEYLFSETEMNTMGYQLLNHGKTTDAIAVFKLNVTQFPKSWNVYDSLGEAYVKNGEVQKAIKNYKKSIEINPKNKGGIAILKKLKEI